MTGSESWALPCIRHALLVSQCFAGIGSCKEHKAGEIQGVDEKAFHVKLILDLAPEGSSSNPFPVHTKACFDAISLL